MSAPRRLRLSIGRSSSGLPVLVAATMACGAEVVTAGPVPATSSSTSATGGSGGTGGEMGGFSPTTSSTGGAGGLDCSFGPTLEVELPPPGVPARAGQICAAMSPVDSPDAARVTLVKYSQAQHLAMGSVAVPAAVLTEVVGLPTVEVVETEVPELQMASITNVAPAMNGFSFHAEWAPFSLTPLAYVRMRLRTTLTVRCDPMGIDTREVHADTWIHLCFEDGDVTWVSSGDNCQTCDVVAEMAPCPIVPDKTEDGLPLAQALRVRLVVVARVGNTMVVWAEHDGGAGMDVDWQVSGGELVPIDADVVAWTPPPGAQQIVCAVQGEDAAAVATLRSLERAA
jgi:hypothetical protein